MVQKEYILPENSGYRIIRQLGRGGEGMVYLVCHLSTEQLRAAKVLTNVRRSRRHELDMMKHLNHPSLPKVIDVLEQDEYMWLIMEYIPGNRLDQSVSWGMARDQIWSVAIQLSQVLMYLHCRKEPIFHLDVKPSNILIRPDQTLVLIDFGAAIRGHPLDEKAGKYGTRGYAAPEQQQKDGVVDAKTDIYGAGAVLYYCCYKCAPVSRESSVIQTGRNLFYWEFNRIICKCLHDNPEKRYQDSRQLYIAICRAQRTERIFRQMGKTVGAMTLLLSVSAMLYHNLSAYSEMSVEYVSENIAGNHSDEWIEKGVESTSGDDLENVFENEAETVIEDRTISTDNSETEKDWENEAETDDTGAADAGEGIKEQEYCRLLNMAGGMGLSQATECYRQALNLFPGDQKWFLQLLEQVMSDGLFEAEEESVVKDLIYTIPSDGADSALEILSADAAGYGLFTYRLGLAYWYYYNGTGGKSAAAWWFRLAIDSQEEETSADWIGSARILSKIGSYYGMLGNTNAVEEREAKEWDYWGDLQELWYLYQEQGESAEIRAQTAEEILSLIVLKSSVLREYGAEREEVEKVLMTIENFLDEGMMADDQEKCKRLKEQSEAAESALERTYQG